MKTRNPGKNRKRRIHADLHVKQKFVSAHLSKELRAKMKKRSLPVRKGDTVKVVRGRFKKKTGKVTAVHLKNGFVFVEGCLFSRQGGKEIQAPLRANSLLLTALTERGKQAVQKNAEKDKTKNEETAKAKQTEEKAKATAEKTVVEQAKSTTPASNANATAHESTNKPQTTNHKLQTRNDIIEVG